VGFRAQALLILRQSREGISEELISPTASLP